MTEEPDPDRLRALEQRLSKLTEKGEGRQQAAQGSGFSQGEVAWRMVIELVSGMILGLAIGYGLDRLFGSLPVFLVIFGLLGFVAGVNVMIRTARDMERTKAGTPAGNDKAAAPPDQGDGRG